MVDFLKYLLQLPPPVILLFIGLFLVASLGFEQYLGMKPRKEAVKFMGILGGIMIVVSLSILGWRVFVREDSSSGDIVKGEPKTAIQQAKPPITATTDSLAAHEVSNSRTTAVGNETCATNDPPITCLFRNP